MCWMLEFCQFPKRRPRNTAIEIIFHKVPNFVICHRSFNNVKLVGFSMTACSNKIEPFIRHVRKTFDIETFIGKVLVNANNVSITF